MTVNQMDPVLEGADSLIAERGDHRKALVLMEKRRDDINQKGNSKCNLCLYLRHLTFCFIKSKILILRGRL